MNNVISNKVLIIGAGNIGVIIANLLFKNGYDLTITDSNPATLNNPDISESAITKLMLDVKDNNALKSALKDMEYVINAGPYFIAYDIAKAAIATTTHYFDLTEDIQQANRIRALDDCTLSSALVPQCGLAPGFISIIATHLAKKFDEVHDIKMRVGALPINPTNMLKYNTSWSVDGLINEYLHPCNAIKNGSNVITEPLEGYETLNLDGDIYEAFNTSGGLGTMCETWNGKVHNMNYKTIRYPGHNYLMKFLINDMKLDKAAIIQMFKSAIPCTNNDVVIIFVEVNGMKDGRFMTESWTKKIYSNEKWTGIQISTATGICIMIDAHKSGVISQIGFVKQESIKFIDFYKIDSINYRGVYS